LFLSVQDERPFVSLLSLFFLLVGGAAHGASQGEDANTVYKIDASKSRFIVRAFVGGVFSAFGHDHTIAVPDFDGEARFVPGGSDVGRLRVSAKAGSFVVTNKISEQDRKEIESTMREKVLETSKYPEIVFRSTSVSASQSPDGSYQVKISGDLSLHGITRNRGIAATVNITGDTLRAKGEFPLLQTDYKITPVSVAAGTVKVKDELKLSFDIFAIKQ
jgi:polyisoprenoid-binding protein YceI